MDHATPTRPQYQLFVGIDIAAVTATVAWMPPGGTPSRPFTIDQTARGFASLQQRLLAHGHPPATVLVALEATGSYWMGLATSLAEAGFAVSVVNPAQAHHFAKALLTRGKTDAIDAQTLAHLAALLQPTPWTPPPAIDEELQQRLAQRAALIELRQQVRNQRHALTQKPYVVAAVRERMDSLIATLTAQIGALEAEITTALQQDDAWAAAAARLQTITGIGVLCTAWLLVATLNFTLCPSPEALTAYAGLVPYQQESGSSVRKRPCIGHTGHAPLRTVVYLAALSATQYNPIIKPFYARLRAQGKSKKVARCAAARKLLHIAWAVATKGQPFDPHYQTGGAPDATTP
jgi:transposase